MKDIVDIVKFIEREFPSLSDAERWKLLKVLLNGKLQDSRDIHTVNYTGDVNKENNKSKRKDLRKAKKLKIVTQNGTEIEVGPGKYATVLRALGINYKEIEKEKRLQGLKTKIDPKSYLISHADELGIQVLPVDDE
ncbi:MAG: hypothetical protein QXG39_03410 [Candidatus Aenigmatarchaeota archaeon]